MLIHLTKGINELEVFAIVKFSAETFYRELEPEPVKKYIGSQAFFRGSQSRKPVKKGTGSQILVKIYTCIGLNSTGDKNSLILINQNYLQDIENNKHQKTLFL